MIKELKATVEEILRECPATRDCDKTLMWKVWEKEAGTNFTHLAFVDFVRFSSPESIRRQRQLSQQFHVELRGSSYADRHLKKEPKVRKEVQEEKWDEIQNINAERLKKHSIAFQYVYNNMNISVENKKVLLADIAKMEKDEAFAKKCLFKPEKQDTFTICQWFHTSHQKEWVNANYEENK